MTDVESIRAWLRQCPLIDANSPFMIDYLSDDPKCYAIYSVPSQIVFKRDILGNVYQADVQTKTYYINVSLPASEDAHVMIANAEALDGISEWIFEQNLAKNFPEIPGMRIQTIAPTLTPYAMQPANNVTVYRMNLQMTYRKD